MSNKYFAVSPNGTEIQMSRLTAENHKNLMDQAGERGWYYGTQEEIAELRAKRNGGVPKVQELSKDIEILELKKQLAEAQAMLVAQDEKDIPDETQEAPMNAKVVIGFINSANSKEEIERIIATETRQSVLKAAKKRITELA